MTPREKLIEMVANVIHIKMGLYGKETYQELIPIAEAIIDYLKLEVVDNEEKIKQGDIFIRVDKYMPLPEYALKDMPYKADIIRRNNNPIINIDNLI